MGKSELFPHRYLGSKLQCFNIRFRDLRSLDFGSWHGSWGLTIQDCGAMADQIMSEATKFGMRVSGSGFRL